MPKHRDYYIRRSILIICAAALIFPAMADSQVIQPDPNIGGLTLQSSPKEVRKFANSLRLKPAETNVKNQEVYTLEQKGQIGRGVGFIPGSNGLYKLFYNQSGFVQTKQAIANIQAKYGKPYKTLIEGGFQKLFYRIDDPKNPGMMVWAVRYDWLGVEMISDGLQAYLDTPEWKRLLERGWKPSLVGICMALGFFFLYRATPQQVRSRISDVLGTVLSPLLSFAGFFGSRFVMLILAFLWLPLMLFSGCAVGAGALEQGTSWLWAIPWVMGFILMLENDASDDFRYLVLAELAFALTAGGVIFQMAI